MFHLSSLLTYMAACSVIILIPGPAQALVLTNSISSGKRAGIVTAVGLNLATIFHSTAAALGLSAILAASTAAFSIVKFIGAAYLIYIGIKTFRTKEETIVSSNKKNSTTRTLTKAFITGVFNPKVAIFFLAFLPQFVDPKNGYILIQFLLLGIILGIMDLLYESLLVILFTTASRLFLQNRHFIIWRRRITGSVLVGLGFQLALAERN